MKKLSLFLLLFVILTSCEDNESSIDLQEQKVSDFEKIIVQREEVALRLSVVLSNEKVFKKIQQELLRSSFSEAELLLSDIVNFEIDKDLKIGNVINNPSIMNIAVLFPRSDFDINKILLSDPLMSLVLMPGKNKSREDYKENFNSKKVYIDKIFDEFIENEAITFYENGNKNSQNYYIDQEPTNPYFAIKINEIYVAYNELTKEIFYQKSNNLKKAGLEYVQDKKYFIKRIEESNTVIARKDLENTNEGSLDILLDERSSCGQPCERDCQTGYEAVTRIKFTHDYEGWPRGGPEFIYQWAKGVANVAFGNVGYTLVTSSASARTYYKLGGNENEWYSKNTSGTDLFNIQLSKWDGSLDSKEMYIHISEDDGSTVSYSTNANLSFKFKIDSVESTIGLNLGAAWVGGDDEVGSTVIHYCDPYSWYGNGYQYIIAGPSGDVYFNQKDRNF